MREGEVRDLSCEDHLRVSTSACNSGRVIKVPVEVKYSYCNNQGTNVVQIANKAKTLSFFKEEEVFIPNIGNNLSGGQCNSWTIWREIDLCKAGASMQVKYEALSSNGDGALSQEYCYAYEFLQASRIWLDPGRCPIQVSHARQFL